MRSLEHDMGELRKAKIKKALDAAPEDSDEAKTGTKDNREGFVKLIEDCRQGKIQLIGSQLMVKMLGLLKCQGYERASLAVQKENYAVKMYEGLGFRTTKETDEEFIMAIEL